MNSKLRLVASKYLRFQQQFLSHINTLYRRKKTTASKVLSAADYHDVVDEKISDISDSTAFTVIRCLPTSQM